MRHTIEYNRAVSRSAPHGLLQTVTQLMLILLLAVATLLMAALGYKYVILGDPSFSWILPDNLKTQPINTPPTSNEKLEKQILQIAQVSANANLSPEELLELRQKLARIYSDNLNQATTQANDEMLSHVRTTESAQLPKPNPEILEIEAKAVVASAPSEQDAQQVNNSAENRVLIDFSQVEPTDSRTLMLAKLTQASLTHSSASSQQQAVQLTPGVTGIDAIPEQRYVVVRRGDTLSSLAKRVLGAPTRYPEILAINPALKNDPHKLRIGMRLVVPDSSS